MSIGDENFGSNKTATRPFVEELRTLAHWLSRGHLGCANIIKYFDTKVSYDLKNIHQMLAEDYPMVKFMSGALQGNGNYKGVTDSLIEYMEMVNISKK